MIPYGRQDITQADIDAVIDVLRSDFLTQGPAVPRFEQALTDYTGANYAAAVSNATAALHVACLALDVGPGDLVWTSPITFVASANCALYCGASVDFVDVEPDTGNMSVEALTQKLETARERGRLPKVVIPVHLTGRSCDMKSIARLADEFGFRVIEDASHAVGATYAGGAVGSCVYSDIAIFSFHPVKIVTTGEGGAALTNDPELAGRLSRLRSHGITRDETLMRSPSHGPWYYQQIELGFNYRLTDLQAALGVSQMSRLDTYVDRRNELAVSYDELLERLEIATPPPIDPEDRSSYHLYVIRVEADRRAVFERLRADGIGVNVHYIPVHLQPYYQRFEGIGEGLDGAMQYYDSAITIPLYPTMAEGAQREVVEALARALQS